MVLCRKNEKAYIFDPKAIAFGESIFIKFFTLKKSLSQRRKERKETKALRLGENLSLRLSEKQEKGSRLAVIDELGPFELNGQGWAKAMDHLMATYHGPMIWVVRESLINEMLQRWPAQSQQVFDVREYSAQTIANKIMATLYDENK